MIVIVAFKNLYHG